MKITLKLEIIFVIIAVVFALIVSLILYPVFFDIGTDGVIYAEMARSIVAGDGISVYDVPHTVFSPLLGIFIAFVYFVIRNLEIASFITNLIIGLASIP